MNTEKAKLMNITDLDYHYQANLILKTQTKILH